MYRIEQMPLSSIYPLSIVSTNYISYKLAISFIVRDTNNYNNNNKGKELIFKIKSSSINDLVNNNKQQLGNIFI
jgi:hypothetical protein